MDAYKARSSARYAGLMILIAVGVALAFMEKQLISLRMTMQSERSTWLGTGNGSPLPVLNSLATARELAASNWSGAEAGDLDGDGIDDILLRIARGSSGIATAVERILVLAPRPRGQMAVLFDSQWATSIASLDSTIQWRPLRVGLFNIELEGIDHQGEPNGARLDVSWRPRERLFRQHISHVDDRTVALYN